jgi:hypothetical protein
VLRISSPSLSGAPSTGYASLRGFIAWVTWSSATTTLLTHGDAHDWTWQQLLSLFGRKAYLRRLSSLLPCYSILHIRGLSAPCSSWTLCGAAPPVLSVVC